MVETGRSRTILFATTEWVTAKTFLIDQLEFFAARGWDVHLACANIPEGIRGARVASSTTLHPLFMKRAPSALRDLRSLFDWLALLRDVHPDVFVGSTPKASFLGLIAATVFRVKSRVYWVHGLRFESQKGIFRWFLQQAERLCVLMATNVFTVSASLDQKLQIAVPAVAQKTSGTQHAHANGVDSGILAPPSPMQKRIARETFHLSPDVLVVGFMGRLTPDKGLLFLAEAMKEVVRKFPDAVLLVAGEPDNAKPYTSSERQAFEVGYVRLVGFQLDRVGFYHALDLFCMPSVREGLSTVNLEAASCGLAVVTTTATGCIDSVVPGSTGIVVPPENSRALSRAIISLLADENHRCTMGTRGRQWVVENFARDQIWAANLAYFDSL